MDCLDLLAVQGTLKSLLQHHSSKASILWRSAFFRVQLSHAYLTTRKTMEGSSRQAIECDDNIKSKSKEYFQHGVRFGFLPATRAVLWCALGLQCTGAQNFGNWPRVRPTPEVLSQIQTRSRAHILTATLPHHQRLRTGGSPQIHPREGLKHPDL